MFIASCTLTPGESHTQIQPIRGVEYSSNSTAKYWKYAASTAAGLIDTTVFKVGSGSEPTLPLVRFGGVAESCPASNFYLLPDSHELIPADQGEFTSGRTSISQALTFADIPGVIVGRLISLHSDPMQHVVFSGQIKQLLHSFKSFLLDSQFLPSQCIKDWDLTIRQLALLAHINLEENPMVCHLMLVRDDNDKHINPQPHMIIDTSRSPYF